MEYDKDKFVKIPESMLQGVTKMDGINSFTDCADYVWNNFSATGPKGFAWKEGGCYIDNGNSSLPLTKDENSDYYICKRAINFIKNNDGQIENRQNTISRLVIRRAGIKFEEERYSQLEINNQTLIRDIIPIGNAFGTIDQINIVPQTSDRLCFVMAERQGGDTKESGIEYNVMLLNFVINPKLYELNGSFYCSGKKTDEDDKRYKERCDSEIGDKDIYVVKNGIKKTIKVSKLLNDINPFLEIERNERHDLYLPEYIQRDSQQVDRSIDDFFGRFNDSIEIDRGRKIKYNVNNNNMFKAEGDILPYIELIYQFKNITAISVSYNDDTKFNGTHVIYTGDINALSDAYYQTDAKSAVLKFRRSPTVENFQGESALFNFNSSLYENKDNSQDNSKRIIFGSVIGGIIILGIIAFVIYKKRRS